MQILTSLVLTMTAVMAQQSAVVKVTVGKNGLTYDPTTLHAEVGTKIEFDFFPKNHSVVQSSFADPCHPLTSGGFFSGFVPTQEAPSGTTFTIEVKDTKPIWFYCAQGNHCQSGMVGAINAPESGNTFEKFAELAKQASDSTAPPTGLAGGVLGNGTNGGNDGSASTTSSAAECSLPPTQTTVRQVQTTSAWTTQSYTSTWTSNGQIFTTTATTTLFSQVPAQSNPPGAAGAAGVTPSFGPVHAGVLAIAAAAMAL